MPAVRPAMRGAPTATPSTRKAKATHRRGGRMRANRDTDEVRRVLEDELADDATGVGRLFPRALRSYVAGAGAVGCAMGVASTGVAVTVGGVEPADTLANFAINSAGAFLCAAWWRRETSQADADQRAEQRRRRVDAQLERGERVVYETPAPSGTIVSTKWRQVDDKWIIKRLERWGKQDRLPSIGPVKGALLQELVRKYDPKFCVEVGTFLGYSAITIAQALSEGSRVVTIEKDLKFVLAAKRFCWQANQGTRAPGEPRVGKRVRIWYGEACDQLTQMARREDSAKIDMLFLDGDLREYLSYLKAAEPMMKDGCVVVADNTRVFAHIDEMQEYLAYVRSEDGPYASEEVPTLYEWTDEPDSFELSVFSRR